MGNLFQDVPEQRLTVFHYPFLMTRGAEVLPHTRKGQEMFMTTRFAFNPRKTKMKIPVLQIPVNDLRDIISPESEAPVALYDPCAPKSRLGIRRSGFKGEAFDGITGLLLHALCEQNADALE